MNTLYEPASFKDPRYYKAFSKITLFIILPFLDLEKLDHAGRKKIRKKTSGAMRGVASWWREEEVATSVKHVLEIYDLIIK